MTTPTKAKATSHRAFRALVGINYGPDDKRADPGEVVTDLPSGDVKWMLDQGIIEAVDVPGDRPSGGVVTAEIVLEGGH